MKTKRIIWIDVLRSFAIFCVVLPHTTERVYQFGIEVFQGYDTLRKIFSISLFTLGRVGVPIFFLKSVPMSHMWYMPVILGIYLMVPWLSNALSHISLKHLLIPYGIAVFYMWLIPTFNVILRAMGWYELASLPDLTLGGMHCIL